MRRSHPARSLAAAFGFAAAALLSLAAGGGSVFAQADLATPAAIPADTVVPGRWTPERAQAYYDARAIPLGADYIPRTAINQLEMWQAETFDLPTIREELGWAAAIGMNSMRVYLHDLVWEQDSTGFFDRVDRYLDVADSLGISTTFVVFDAVWNPVAALGEQPAPRPHIHNSGWVQSPTEARLLDAGQRPVLEAYVRSLLRQFGGDPRVYMWDLYNEPSNDNFGKFPDQEMERRADEIYGLMVATFGWARAVAPSQPLTAGVWIGDRSSDEALDRFNRFQLHNSDIISYHDYNGEATLQENYDNVARYGRPVVCTEYVARGQGNGFLNVLPFFAERRVGAYNWGLVSGRTQTIYPWNSWDSTYTDLPPLWHHDVFWPDGRPYDPREIEVIEMVGEKYKSE